MTKPVELPTYSVHLCPWLSWSRSMPDRSVDHVVTDPPYLAHTHRSQRRGTTKRGKRSTERSVDFSHLTPELRRVYAAEMARLARRWLIVFSDAEGWQGWRDDLEDAGLVVPRQLVWVRGAHDLDDDGARVLRGNKGAPQFNGMHPAAGHEVMALAHRVGVKMRWNGRGARRDGTGGKRGGGDVYTHEIETEGRVHQAQKPLALMRELVRDFTDLGDTILDPFAGSGTTLLAAKIEGRSAIGVEEIRRYAVIAANRVGLPGAFS